MVSFIVLKTISYCKHKYNLLENDYMKNDKPKSEVINEEIIGETSTSSAPSVEENTIL